MNCFEKPENTLYQINWLIPLCSLECFIVKIKLCLKIINPDSNRMANLDSTIKN